MSQECNACGLDKDLSEYYLIDGYKPFRRCKTCVIAKRPKKPKALTGWEQLSDELRAAVIKDLQNRRIKMKRIAEDNGINYSNLCYWVRSGQCV